MFKKNKKIIMIEKTMWFYMIFLKFLFMGISYLTELQKYFVLKKSVEAKLTSLCSILSFVNNCVKIKCKKDDINRHYILVCVLEEF